MMNKFSFLLLYLIFSCKPNRGEIVVVNDQLYDKITSFIEYIDSEPFIKAENVVTVYIRSLENEKNEILIRNSEPESCKNLIGEKIISNFKVYFVVDSKVRGFIQNPDKYTCKLKRKTDDFPINVHYYEEYYLYEDSELKPIKFL
jgi:hypothetical protein